MPRKTAPGIHITLMCCLLGRRQRRSRCLHAACLHGSSGASDGRVCSCGTSSASVCAGAVGGFHGLPPDWGCLSWSPIAGVIPAPCREMGRLVFASRTHASSSPFPLPLARSCSPPLCFLFSSPPICPSHIRLFLGDEFLTVNMVGTVVHLLS